MYHFDDFGIQWLREDLLVVGDVVQYLVESRSLYLFGSKVGHWVVEIKHITALLYLLQHERLPVALNSI